RRGARRRAANPTPCELLAAFGRRHAPFSRDAPTPWCGYLAHMSTVALPRFSSPSRALARPADWTLWCAVASSLTVAFGVHWDIAWHRSIGRDAFWSPPHVAIYAGAVFAAVAALAQILPATFGPGRGR